ncbi:lysozyme inhibitor LprI family protein [Azospirillum sp. ST 5-10]|uniref:lysozyme inhibitor LprI family protein n=1 Tax=unclassified Azospirillum TaxID=2630922 RepID=UPI003F49C7F8
MRMIGVVLAAGLAVGLAAGRAQGAPSFDCKAASTAVEKAICADEALALLDQRIAEAFSAVMDVVDAAGRDRLRAEQKGWIAKVRNGCAAHPAAAACLAGVMEARARQLEAAVAPATEGLAQVVRSIADDPDAAARSLGERRGALGRAWLAYAQRYGARPDPAKAATTLSAAVAALTDSYPQDIARDQDLRTDEGFLTALRLVNDVHDMALPCFVVTRHGAAGWAAVQPIYGSTRDGAAPMPDCAAGDGGLFDDPAWRAVDALFDPMMGAAYGRTGTIRSTVGRAVEISRLMAAVEPRRLADAAAAFDGIVAEVAAWRNPRWVGEGWPSRFRAAMDAALLAWEKRLSADGLDPATVRSVARGAAADMLGTMVPFITDYVELAADTRVPEWLRGAWTWDRAAGEAAFPVTERRGRITVDAAAVCLTGDTSCRSLEAVEAEDDARAGLLDAAASLAPPRVPAEPLQAVVATGEAMDESFAALRLADGSVLVQGDGAPATVLTRAK